VIAHRVDGVRRFAARTGDTCLVEAQKEMAFSTDQPASA
jgi:hypothetical protein